MKRMMALMLMCLLLPAAALAVTEGVVENAPLVSIDLPPIAPVGEPQLLEAGYQEMAKRLEQAALEASAFLLGSPMDMQLTLAQAPVWYGPARIAQDGSVEYDEEVRKGMELTFERRSKKVVRSIRALFDLETEKPIMFRNEYDMESLEEGMHGGKLMDDGFALRMAKAGLEFFPGCAQIEMTLSPKSDGRYAVAYGRTAYGWHVNTTIDRAKHAVIAVEWISDDHSASLAEMRE